MLLILLLFGELFSGDLWIYLHNPNMISIEHFFTSFIIFGVFGAIFVYVGALTAPRHHKAVAMSLFGLIAIVFGFLTVTLLLIHPDGSWRMILNFIICIAASGITAFLTEDELI